jgi:prepilin-type N-terminal cleavage/methylation domain-containing protein
MRKSTAPAFTLIEMLIVIAIAGVLFVISFVLGGRSRETFVASQQTREVLQEIRSSRRRSMLVTKETTEAWVHGVGIEFSQIAQTGKWQYKYVKLQHRDGINSSEVVNYYLPYPPEQRITNGRYVFNEITPAKEVANDGKVTFYKNDGTTVVTSCSNKPVRIMFESINGGPHVYCGATEWEKNLVIGLTGTNIKIKISTNGDISPMR